MNTHRLPIALASLAAAAGLAATLALSLARAQPPKDDAPKTDAPKADAPKADAPKGDAPGGDAPQADAPKGDAPGGDAPQADAPKADAPKADEVEKPIDFEPIPVPEEKLKVPQAPEWKTATRVQFASKGPRAKGCRMYRVREWLKVHCDGQTTAVGLMGGTVGGAYMYLPPAKEGEPAPTSADVIFPMREGDRRVFELFSFGPTYGGSMISPGLVLQEHWIAGDPAPTVVLR